MPQAIKPWEPSNFPSEIQDELNRRKVNRSFSFVEADKGGWESSGNGDWKKYNGPMSPWVRFCSNGIGKQYQIDSNGNYVLDRYGNRKKLKDSDIKPGFVFFGGKDFYSGYGINNTEKKESIIGYVPDKTSTPHIIENLQTSQYPINVPPPEIEKINVTIQKELYRRATIEWVCFSKAQMEYMTPYFLIPGISCVLEWGWNHYDTTSLIDLSETKKLKKMFNNPYLLYTENILKSKGNYDVIIGIVTHFEWAMEGNKIKCKTEITSKDRIYAGLIVDSNVEEGKTKNDFVIPYNSLSQFIDKEIFNFKNINATDSIEKSMEKVSPIKPFIASPYNSLIEQQKQIDAKSTQPSSFNNFLSAITSSISKILDSVPKTGLNGNGLETLQNQLYPDNKKSLDTYASSSLNFNQFISYVNQSHPNNWTEYVYGVFYGRNLKDPKGLFQEGANKKEDFDYKSHNDKLWINFGLLIEIINFHASSLTHMGQKELFHIDIDDVVIGGHPNLISSNGDVCLIPNAMAPKYFFGPWYALRQDNRVENENDYLSQMQPSTYPSTDGTLKMVDAERDGKLADYRIKVICKPIYNIYRDDIDEIINGIRYNNTNVGDANNFSKSSNKYSFPFINNVNEYPAKFSGYLKNIYVNVTFLQSLINNSDVKTYPQFIKKVLEGISGACGDFWDFSLVGGSGSGYDNDDDNNIKISSMKIVDNKFMASINKGKVFTFDYYDSDSLLLGVNFKPTISNAQAIRSIYSKNNHPDKTISIINGNNELLDYKFEDRLTKDDEEYSPPVYNKDISGFVNTMRELQQVRPIDGSYQITCVSKNLIQSNIPTHSQSGIQTILNSVPKTGLNGNGLETLQNQLYPESIKKVPIKEVPVIRRLVLPSAEILRLLLDDGDEENNPKYTGIMPGIQATFTIQGIGGLRTFMMFLVRNLPEPYSHKNIVFRIVDVVENVENGKWITTITAGIIPLRGFIKKRLGIDPK
jgi:hypothetical protein